MRIFLLVASLGIVVAMARDCTAAPAGHEIVAGEQRVAKAAAPVDGLAALRWLAGHWIIDDGDLRTEEIWTEPSTDLMLGMSRAVRDGKTESWEFMRIAARPDGVFYIAQPRGKPPVEFPLQSWDGAQAVFVNPGSGDHLRRIVYRRNDDGSLTARIEGANGGREFAEDYPYRRAAADAHGAAR